MNLERRPPGEARATITGKPDTYWDRMSRIATGRQARLQLKLVPTEPFPAWWKVLDRRRWKKRSDEMTRYAKNHVYGLRHGGSCCDPGDADER